MKDRGLEDEEKAKEEQTVHHPRGLKTDIYDVPTHMNATRIHDIENGGSLEIVAEVSSLLSRICFQMFLLSSTSN